jgi:hypothetical protein
MKTEISAIGNRSIPSIKGAFAAAGNATLRVTSAQPPRGIDLGTGIVQRSDHYCLAKFGALTINLLLHVINRRVSESLVDRPRYLRVNPDAILPRVGFLLEIERPC